MTLSPKTRLSQDEKEYILKKANKIPTVDIATYIGCTTSAVRYFLHKQGIPAAYIRRWNIPQTEKLISLCTGEYSIKEIAHMLRMPHEIVKNRIYFLRNKKGMNLIFHKLKEK